MEIRLDHFHEEMERVLFDELDASEVIEAIDDELEAIAVERQDPVREHDGRVLTDYARELRQIRKQARELRV